MNTPRNFLARLFACAVAAVLMAVPVSTGALGANSEASFNEQQLVSSQPGVTLVAQTVNPVQAPATPFDGHKLYKEVFEHLRDRHKELTDSTKRAAWVAEWQNKHATDGALDTEDGANKAVREMMQSLGQRFDYYNDPEATKREKQTIDPTLVGIASPVQVKGAAEAVSKLPVNASKKEIDDAARISDDQPLFIPEEPFEGGPAATAGLKEGDRITKVDGVAVKGKTIDEVIEKIRGQAGTKVQVTVERNDGKGGTTAIDYDITRAKFVAPVVKFKDLGNGISYIRLKDFMSKHAESEMAAALTKAAKGKAVIIDLRGNGGGRLDAVETMGEYLLEEGTLLTMKQRQGSDTETTHTVLRPGFTLVETRSSTTPNNISIKTRQRESTILPADMPIIVLVDGGSASASEILSGLLQANHRAIIVGKTTLGKGVGQALINLSWERNIHVTTFEFLPGGKAMDWIGIIPDVEVDQPKTDIFQGKDTQLDKAKEVAADAVKKAEALEKARQDTRAKNEAEWQKRLQQRNSTNGGSGSGGNGSSNKKSGSNP